SGGDRVRDQGPGRPDAAHEQASESPESQVHPNPLMARAIYRKSMQRRRERQAAGVAQLKSEVSGVSRKEGKDKKTSELDIVIEKFTTEFQGIVKQAFPDIIEGAIPGPDALKSKEVNKLLVYSQRQAILRFCEDHVVPEGLFTGSHVGTATAQQRILM